MEEGGGAGGYLTDTDYTVSATAYGIVVGAGGAINALQNNGSQGSNTTFSTFTAVGGGYGSDRSGGHSTTEAGGNGGSGGGGRG